MTRAPHRRPASVAYPHFRELVESISDIVFVIGPTGKIDYVNPSGLRLLGLGLPDVVGTEFVQLLTDESRLISHHAFGSDSSVTQTTLFEVELRRGDGTAVALEVRVGDVLADAVRVGRFGVGRNLNEIRRMQSTVEGKSMRSALILHGDRLAQQLYRVSQQQTGPPETGSEAMSSRALECGMTAPQVEVLRLMAAGLTNREIGERQGVSTETIKDRVADLMTNLGTRRRTALVARAINLGLLPTFAGER